MEKLKNIIWPEIAGFLKKYKGKVILFGLITIVIVLLFNLLFVEQLEMKAFDLRTLLRRKPADPNIVIVDINDRTIKEAAHMTKEGLGKWPWPRPTYSKVIKFISEGKPQVIVADFSFSTSSQEYKNPEFNDEKFIEELKGIPDLFFVHTIKTKKSDLFNFFNAQDEETKKKILETVPKEQIQKQIMEFGKFLTSRGPAEKIKNFYYEVQDNVQNNESIQNNLNYYDMPVYLNAIYESSTGIGINVHEKDKDRTLRSIQPIFKYNNKFLFSIDLAVAYFLRGDNEKVTLDKYKLIVGKTVIPLTKKLTFYLNWRSNAKKPENKVFQLSNNLHYYSIPFIEVFKEEYGTKDKTEKLSPDIFKDKIVLIGATAEQLKDYYKVPNKKIFPGVETIATGIDNFLNDSNFIKKAPPLLNLIVTLLLCACIVLIFYVYPLSKTSYMNVYYSISLLMVYVLLNIWLFMKAGLWLDIINPLFSSGVTVVLAISVSLLVEKDKRSLVEDTFSKYVSPQVYKTLLSDTTKVDLTAYRDDISILFCDIRGFTPFAEFQTPEEVSRYLNEYFTEMVEVILANDGTIDKFMGDAVMAFFGAPIQCEDHAFKAAKTALEMIEHLDQLNEKWIRLGKRMLNIGIGVNSGSALIGNYGSPKLMDYTVIGDAVNLASRLESLNKEVGTNILISAFTYQQIKDKVKVNIIGQRRVKGKSEPVVVYELLGLEDAEGEE